MPTDYEALIDQAAADPASATVDGQTATSRPLGDIIKAADRAAGQQALDGTSARGGPRSGWRCLRMARATPPGTTDTNAS